ncbi:YbaB/EbfC family nucleoid-associated protein [Nocardia callitridis]|uniref:YbaB/EbfC family DNA-binding protein n=1 Tax=Nocardia callitridis TaxID=648753 RepID=A0ABP9KL80_9NOCA
MNDAEQSELRARNNALRDQVDSMLSAFDEQRRELTEAQGQLAAATGEAWSSDNLVRVVCNVAGIPLEVQLDEGAFKRSTPQKLGRSIAEAAQAAAAIAARKSAELFAPVNNLADEIPDLSDLIPGAPSIKDLVASLIPDAATQPPAQPDPPHFDDEDEDDYYRNRSYLEDRRR